MTTSDIAATRHTYGTDPEQFGELRLPVGSGPHPAIVYVHGGGYRSSITLAGAAGMCASLTARGYATWSIEYRRIGNGGGWPTTFEDVLSAAAHLHTLAVEANIDLQRVLVAGQSAGGQLALWLASGGHGMVREHAPLPAFRAVVALAPASNLRSSAANPSAPIQSVMGGSPQEVSERYAAVSPIELASISGPQLIVHGTADTVVPYAMSQAYIAAASARGDQVQLVTVEGAEHLDLWNPASAAFGQVVDAAVQFLGAAGVPV
jgi:acetyl esterase/lipase